MSAQAAARMDFFAHQEKARRRTGVLVGLFALSVFLIALAIYYVVAFLFQAAAPTPPNADAQPAVNVLFDPGLFAIVAGIVVLIVGAGSLYQIANLSAGGGKVAEMLGGQPVHPATTDTAERRLLNIVEEMAIASGMPPPRVYILPNEPGINAFAAGYSARDAVVAVTRGACDQLSRDQLQGVVAHEFSHILNGDMRLNIRLMGLLHGLLVMSLIGYGLFRALGSAPRDNRRSKDNAGALIIALMLIGLAVMIIGYIGVFFGNIIKAAVSRQREFLADASAVQFTRNPDGLAGALKKIAAIPEGSRLQSPRASEASHLFFSNGIRSSFLGLLATHPPLLERIRRLDPAFSARGQDARAEAEEATPVGRSMAVHAGIAAGTPPPLPGQSHLAQSVQRVGTITPAALASAAALLNAIPESLREQARTPQGAMAIIYALALSSNEEVRNRQLAALYTILNQSEQADLLASATSVSRLARHLHLPLASLAFQPLRLADQSVHEAIRANLLALAEADNHLDMFEFLLLRSADKNLAPVTQRIPIRHFRRNDVAGQAQVLFSAIAYACGSEAQPEASFQAAARAFGGMAGRDALLPQDACRPDALGPALDEIKRAAPSLKKALLAAAAAGVCADQNVTPDEAELFRAIADDLDCPMPPLKLAA